MRSTTLTGALLALLAFSAASSSACFEQSRTAEPVREIYSPTFTRVPERQPVREAVKALEREWRGAAGDTLRRDLRSAQAAAVVLSLLLILAAGVNWRELRDGRHLDLLLLWATGACLFNSMRFFERNHLQQPTYFTLLDWVFTAVTVLSALLIVRAIVRTVRPPARAWMPSLPVGALAVLATSLLATNVALALMRPPDDAGWFANLGAQRLRERALLPYGDPMLTHTPGAAYGPLLYAAHVPFQLIVSPAPVNAHSPDRPQLGQDSTYYAPPALATQLCTAAFHLAGVGALFVAARRLAGTRTALSAVCLYCGSLAVVGIGGQEYSVAGMTFASHIAPAAATLVAFAALPRASLSGALLVAAAGVGFYPAFMGPAWLGYYWNDRRMRMQFIAGCAVTALILSGAVFMLSRAAEGQSRMATILSDTFGHHTDLAGYGSSPFGFWGQREGVRRALTTPLGGSDLTTPLWLGMVALMAASAFLARGRSPAALALLSAAIAIAAAIVKPHATGTYMAWYYGLFLLGLCGSLNSAAARTTVNR